MRFGGAKHPPYLTKCLNTWKEIYPDFKIVEWTENNVEFDCEFVKGAYKETQWAFVADYFRAHILYTNGGLYLNTDMILLQKFDHHLDSEILLCEEMSGIISGGIIGAIPKHTYFKEILEYYRGIDFVKENRPLLPKVLTYFYAKLPLGIKKNIKVLEKSTFYPLPFKNRDDNYLLYIDEQTLGVHLWSESWKTPSQRFYENRTLNNLLETFYDAKLGSYAALNILRYLRLTDFYHSVKLGIGYLMMLSIRNSKLCKKIICDQKGWRLTQRKLFTPEFQSTNSQSIEYVTTRGHKFEINSNEYNGWLTKYNFFDRHIFKVINMFINETSSVIDVGGNIGFYSVLFASQASKGVIHTFEPNPKSMAFLRSNIRANNLKNIKLYNLALGQKSEKYDLQDLDRNNSGKAFISINTHGSAAVKSLDNFSIENTIANIDFIKVDIEGYELNFLKGAKQSIANWRPVLYIELNDSFLQRYGSTALHVIKLIEEWKYIIFDTDAAQISSRNSLLDVSTDILCIPKERLDLVGKFTR